MREIRAFFGPLSVAGYRYRALGTDMGLVY